MLYAVTCGLAFALQVRIIDEFNTPTLSGIDASSSVSYGLSVEQERLRTESVEACNHNTNL